MDPPAAQPSAATAATSSAPPVPPELAAPQRERLAPYLVRRELPDGTLLIRRGDTDRTAYFLERGELQVYVVGGPPNSHRIALLRPGALVGEPALFAGGARMAHVEALGEAVVWGLGHEAFERLAAAEPALALALLRHAGALMAARMRDNLERGIPLT